MKTYEKFDLYNYNSYKLLACCAKAYFPDNENDIVELFQKEPQIRKFILGNGNNVILSKKWYDESFIILNGCLNRIEIRKTEIAAEAGATMLQLSELALSNSLSGFEIFYDIPSSVGGAVVMNAGAADEEVKDLLIKVRYLDLYDGQVKELFSNELGFSYRNSYFQKNTDKIVLKAWFRLKHKNTIDIKAKMEENKSKRWAKQPREYPNCGSVFKRPIGRYVGPLVDNIGLKGFSVGGAKISEKHSGFIINTGNATGKDILELIEIIKMKVNIVFNIDLEIEQRII